MYLWHMSPPVICGLLKVSYQSINKTLLMELLGVDDGETVWGWRSSVLCVCVALGAVAGCCVVCCVVTNCCSECVYLCSGCVLMYVWSCVCVCMRAVGYM